MLLIDLISEAGGRGIPLLHDLSQDVVSTTPALFRVPSMCWVTLSRDVHKLLQQKPPAYSASSGRFDEVTWNRGGSVVWSWNLADGSSYLPQDFGV